MRRVVVRSLRKSGARNSEPFSTEAIAHVGETVEELLEDEGGQQVVGRPLNGEHLDARALPRPRP